ncbi:MAG: DEAD/DEAH box helicase [Clostridiales bacterium]|nr:DEAD/DEAH box helicase [Clostridiales bacterium]
MDTFDRYAPFIQDYIYQNGWESLRAVQAAAADVIFNTDENLLLSASTASGKTEAAFFPILTLFTEDMPSSVGAIYIGPLKALINDQFSRLNDLCQEANIPVWHWHGDVSQSHKNKMMKHPSGILQITPESLEAMLLHKHSAITKLFGDLRFIVIDEIHSLMRGDRGGQTLCLIERLCRQAGVNPRRIGLSATIGDPKEAGAFLSAGTGRKTIIPKLPQGGIKWRLSMEHFYTFPPTNPGAPTKIHGQVPQEASSDEEALLSASEMPDKPKSTTAPATTGNLSDSRNIPAKARFKRGPSSTESIVTNDALSPENGFEPEDALSPRTDIAPKEADPGIGYIFEHTRGKKCLVFVNSREECEAVTTTLRQYCEAKNEPDRFLIHHGNLSEAFRQTAEAVMKDEEQFQTTVTTATLELGIDIGRLERAFQIDAPYTVSSFLQRMGRTGRRDLPPEMWFVMREEPPEARALLPATIPWKLIQGIALVQLYLEERWVEPPKMDALPYSLLYHQTMSILASCGEMTPAELASRVLTLRYFRKITQEDFRILLRHLLETGHIERTEAGGLIVGLAGERVVNNYKFYAVFQENEEYTVRAGSEELGTIVKPPPAGEKIAIAGHVWLVDEVDHKRHMVYCELIKGKVPAYFGEVPGDIHTRILERMLGVLCEEKSYPYLMKNARIRLAAARTSVRNAGLDKRSLICLGGSMYALFPWLGTYAFLALERFLKLTCGKRLGIKGVDSSRPYFIQFVMTVSELEFWTILREELNQPIDPISLVYPREVPIFDKYDEYLPEALVKKGFAYGVLDIEEMKAKMLRLCERELH